jgi:hypothetical protein
MFFFMSVSGYPRLAKAAGSFEAHLFAEKRNGPEAGGRADAVGASLIAADANKQRSIAGEDWQFPTMFMTRVML